MTKKTKEKGWVQGGRWEALMLSRSVTVPVPGLGEAGGGILPSNSRREEYGFEKSP